VISAVKLDALPERSPIGVLNSQEAPILVLIGQETGDLAGDKSADSRKSPTQDLFSGCGSDGGASVDRSFVQDVRKSLHLGAN
jgi:hypothetical protein